MIYVDTILSKTGFEQEALEFCAPRAPAGRPLKAVPSRQGKTIETSSARRVSIDARRLTAAIRAGWGATPQHRQYMAGALGVQAHRFCGLLHDTADRNARGGSVQAGIRTPKSTSTAREQASHTMLSSRAFTSPRLQDLPIIARATTRALTATATRWGSRRQIPLGARYPVAIPSSLTHKRHYREPMPVVDVIELIREQVGTAFDPVVVTAFEQWVHGEYIPSQRKRAAHGDAASDNDVNPATADGVANA